VAEIEAWCGTPVGAFAGESEFSQDRRNALPPSQTLRGSLVRWLYLLLSPLARFAPLEAEPPLDDGADMAPYGVDTETVFLPDHSPGSLGILTANRDLFVGELFVNQSVLRQAIDLSDRDAWERSYERDRALEPRMVYGGEGASSGGAILSPIGPARYQLPWWVRYSYAN
jgi:glyoxylase-like metal-dependent hydrolase (beta-lactamase superfamily II)